jgi:hypothetical protein
MGTRDSYIVALCRMSLSVEALHLARDAELLGADEVAAEVARERALVAASLQPRSEA